MGLFDMFTNQSAAPATPAQPEGQPNAPTPPGNIPDQATSATQSSPQTAPNGVVPVTSGEEAPDTPLADFKDLWDTPTVDPNNPSPQEPKQLTAEDIQKVVANADFAQGLAPETIAAISEGGEGAQQAFQAAMNEVARQVMVQATLVNNRLTEKAVSDAIEAHNKKLPDLLKEQATANHMNTEDPIFQNPAIKPVIEATRSQLLVKHPDATPAQIMEMTKNYVQEMGKLFNPEAAKSEATGDGGTDWNTFLEQG